MEVSYFISGQLKETIYASHNRTDIIGMDVDGIRQNIGTFRDFIEHVRNINWSVHTKAQGHHYLGVTFCYFANGL